MTCVTNTVTTPLWCRLHPLLSFGTVDLHGEVEGRVPVVAWSGVELAVPAAAGVLWLFTAPLLVSAADHRLRLRNPDHFSRLVRLNRAWGVAACLLGFAVVRLQAG